MRMMGHFRRLSWSLEGGDELAWCFEWATGPIGPLFATAMNGGDALWHSGVGDWSVHSRVDDVAKLGEDLADGSSNG